MRVSKLTVSVALVAASFVGAACAGSGSVNPADAPEVRDELQDIADDAPVEVDGRWEMPDGRTVVTECYVPGNDDTCSPVYDGQWHVEGEG
jgi:hypothetical protein